MADQPTMKDSGPFYYVTEERAFAPGIAAGWPKVIPAPHSPHGRLVRRDGDPSELLAALKDAREWVCSELCSGQFHFGKCVELADVIAKAEATHAAS